jgi:AraC-like DNA-binding protein
VQPSSWDWHDGRPARGAGASSADRRRSEVLRVWQLPEAGDVEVIAGTAIHVCVPRHAHAEYQVAAVGAGALRKEIGGTAHVGTAGALLVCRPDEPHAARSARDGGWSGVLLHVPPAAVAAAAAGARDGGSRAGADGPPDLPVCGARPPLHAAAGALARALADLDVGGLPMAVEARVDGVLAAIAGHGAAARVAPARGAAARGRRDPTVRRLREYLDAHATGPADALALNRLAREAGLSRWHVLRVFAHAVGLPPHAYVMQRRIALAKRALAAGRPLAAVALDVGFAHQSHFTRHFSRVADMSPGRYARLCRPLARGG